MLRYLIWLYLLFLAYEDYKNQKISLYICLLPMLFKGGMFFFRAIEPQGLLLACLPGFILLLLAIWMPYQIGLGDGFTFLMLGLWFDFWQMMSILFISLLLHGVGGIIMMWRNKGKSDTSLAFIPFVFLSYWLCWIGGI